MATPTINQYTNARNNGYLYFSIIENPIVEPLDGPLYIDHLMLRFPERIYNRSRESHLYRFLTALAGDSGAGRLKKQSLYTRMKYETGLLSFEDLDGSYSSFGFARLPNEVYRLSAKDSFLTSEEWDAIRSADVSYRRRIMDFYQSTRYGASPEGMRLAAKAGSGQEMEIRENYRAIFDSLSDAPLGIESLGNTHSTSEFILQPALEYNRNNVERYATLSITPPTTGFLESDYMVLAYNNVESSSRIYFLNISAAILQSTIENFGAVNSEDVTVTQITSTSYQIRFNTEGLNVARLKISEASLLSGAKTNISYSFIDSAFYTTDYGQPRHEYYDAVISGNQPVGGRINEEPVTWLNPALERNMNDVIDRLKPVSSVATVKAAEQREISVSINSVFASSEKFVVNRFVKGDPNAVGATDDPVNGLYIYPGVEREERTKPYAAFDISVISMTINGIIGYKSDALYDTIYNTPSFYAEINNNESQYISYRDGTFDPFTKIIFPFLMYAPASAYSPERALPDETTQLVMTASPVL